MLSIKKGFKLTKSIIALTSLAVASFAMASNASAKETRINIVTASPGGVWYSLGARYAQLLEQNIDNVIVTSSQGGSVPNARQVDAGEAQVGVIYADFAQKAFVGEAPFREKLENLRILATIAPGKLQVAVPSSTKIESLADLADKRINPTKVGWGTRDVVEMVLQEGAGLSFNDIKSKGGNVFALDHSDGMNMMVNGQLDALFFLGGAASSIMSLHTNPGIRVVPIDGEIRDNILNADSNKDNIFFADEITSSMYDFLEQPVPTISVMQVLLINKDMSEDLVYEMTKVIYEQSEDLKTLFSGQQDEAFKIEDATKGNVIPYHAGAKRYFEEQGVSVK